MGKKHLKRFSTSLACQGNSNQTFISTSRAIIKRHVITSVDKDVKKLEPFCTAGGNVKWRKHFGKGSGRPSDSETELSYHLSILLLRKYPRKMKTYPHKNLYMNIHSSIFHNSQKEETTLMSTNG